MVKTKKEDPEPEEQEDLKPGQKFPTPTPGMADRVFYETLLRQKPDSVMAQEWCVNYGVLPKDEAGALFKKMIKRKKGKVSATASSASAPKKPRKSSPKIIGDVAVDVGMQVGGGEAMGTRAL